MNQLLKRSLGNRVLFYSTNVATKNVPETFPQLMVLPLSFPLFPYAAKTILVKNPSVMEYMRNIYKTQPYVGSFLSKLSHDQDFVSSTSDVYKIGTFCQILKLQNDPQGLSVVLLPHRRIRLKSIAGKLEIPTIGEVENVIHHPYSKNPLIKALTSELLNSLKTLVILDPGLKSLVTAYTYSESNFSSPANLSFFIASILNAPPESLQDILESDVMEERIYKVLELLKREVLYARLKKKMKEDIQDTAEKSRRNWELTEMMKEIQKELGEGDGRESLVIAFEKGARDMPEEIRKLFHEELNSFKGLEPTSPNYSNVRNYLSWLSSLPWQKRSTPLETGDIINSVRHALDKECFGMKNVKNRVLEALACDILKKSKSSDGKVLCLVGPPGVGKTSIGHSIAKALNKPFYRFSVGGLSDVSEIKGHRRTYVGAMPGKFIQALKVLGVKDGVMMIDEIDKISSSAPASALLEVLDPEMSGSFTDHYIDLPVDLSEIFFICTANDLSTISAPLLDRMEVVHLTGYSEEEKIQIITQFLEVKARENVGLNDVKEGLNVTVNNDVWDLLVRDYSRESGVRNVKRLVDKVFRKSVFKLLKNQTSVHVTSENLKEFIGNPIWKHDAFLKTPVSGVVTTLSSTNMGGFVTYIEAASSGTSEGSNKELYITGIDHQVTTESATIALSVAKSILKENRLDNSFFQTNSLHLNIPGQIHGPTSSFGLPFALSFISIALNKPIPYDIAFMGELTITGKIIKGGGVAEKLRAAKRIGLKRIVLPCDDMPEYEDIDDAVKNYATPIFVNDISEVFKLIF